MDCISGKELCMRSSKILYCETRYCTLFQYIHSFHGHGTPNPSLAAIVHAYTPLKHAALNALLRCTWNWPTWLVWSFKFLDSVLSLERSICLCFASPLLCATSTLPQSHPDIYLAATSSCVCLLDSGICKEDIMLEFPLYEKLAWGQTSECSVCVTRALKYDSCRSLQASKSCLTLQPLATTLTEQQNSLPDLGEIESVPRPCLFRYSLNVTPGCLKMWRR